MTASTPMTETPLEALVAELDKHGLVAVPKEPTPEMLYIIMHGEWPADWEAGKRAQIRLGLARVAPKTEIEMAWGQYERLLEAALRARAALPREEG